MDARRYAPKIRSLVAFAWTLRPFAIALTGVAVSTAVAHLVSPAASLEELTTIYLLGIVLISMRLRLPFAIVAALASVVSFDYFFLRPPLPFAWTDAKYFLTFGLMILVAGVISGLNQRLRDQEQLARELAFRAEALYELKNELSRSSDRGQLTAVTTRHLERLFSARAVVLLGRPNAAFDPEQLSLAERAWIRREFVVDTSGGRASIWVPVLGIQGAIGVIGLFVPAPFGEQSTRGLLLSACAAELATTIERAELAETAHQSQLEAEAERLRSSLLSAVSHDLKTPLSSIIAAGTTLLGRRNELDEGSRDELLATIVSESERLSRLIQNLLSITRLDSPRAELRRTAESVEEIVFTTLEAFGNRLGRERLRVALAADLPLVSVEPTLIEQVLANLVENALRYAGTSCIEVSAQQLGESVVVQVADRGAGIAQDEREKVFEKFYRGRSAGKNDGGMGLGLTICRAIVRAHGGNITARERSGGGALIEFTLPIFPGAARL